MTLSPLDIRRQQFAKAFRGYEPAEVDAFLKQLSEQWETVQEDLRRAQERTRDAEAKLEHYEKVELALQEALESARDTARRAEASAEEKARLIVEQAELKAERIVHDAERERYGLRQDVVKLNARQTEVAARLRGFLLSELEVLAQFQGDDPVGFIKLQAATPTAALPRPPAQLAAGDDEPWDEREPSAPAGAFEPAPADEPPAPIAAPLAPEAEAPPASPAEPPSAPSAPPPAAPEPTSPTPSTRATPPPFETLAPAEPAASPAPAETPAASADAHRPSSAPSTEAPPSDPSSATGDAASSEEAPADESPRAVTGGWDLRSLVTGEERSVAASEAERDRIRRILDDLD